MDLTTLIERARSGDPMAFTELVQRYQQLAFGYAYVILRDFHLAQDAAQQAFIAVHGSLTTLEDPEKFPSWLRGIVRHQCSRILRKRKISTVTLDAVVEPSSSAPGPEQSVEHREMLDAVLDAINALPDLQREVTVLYYLREYSQQEVATFLGLPITTVNNRLHAARTRLRASLLPPDALGQALGRRCLPDRFAEEVGRIVSTMGPIADVRVMSGDLPPIFETLSIRRPQPLDAHHLHVAQHPGGGVARCIVLSPAAAFQRAGQRVVRSDDTGHCAVTRKTVEAVIDLLDQPQAGERPVILQTGIKAVDLLCPFPAGGRIRLFGDPGVGKLVLIQELVRRVSVERGRLTVFAFVRAADEVPFLRDLAARDEDLYPSSPAIQVVYLPVDEPQAALAGSASSWFDATVYLTEDLARERIFPAVDPLLSSSRLLRSSVVGEEHARVAGEVRRLVRRYRHLQTRSTSASLTTEEQEIVTRARRVECFLSQPLYAAASWTRQPGRFVTREETVRAFQSLLSGDWDAVPEDEFRYRGSLDEVQYPPRTTTAP